MKDFIKRYAKIEITIFVLLCLYACVHQHKKPPEQHTTLITALPMASVLYYSGIIEPLKTSVITTPTDGVINEIFFHFGDKVKQNQLLFTISSDKFQADYKSALMQYIKVKTDYANSQNQLRESQFLHKNQLISEDDYKAKKIAYYHAQLALVQAKDVLENMQKQVALPENIDDLKIENINKLTEVLHTQNALKQIRIVSSSAGVILLPRRDENNDSDLKKITKAESVKQGEVIAVIGDVSGITLRINVSEFNINKIKIGQKVKVSGAAFPDFVLEGEIAEVHWQGRTTQGSLPVFPVEIIVPKLTAAQAAVIHIGMSAKIAINVGDSTKIIAAGTMIQKPKNIHQSRFSGTRSTYNRYHFTTH